MAHIVIVGGGFVGVDLAKRMAKRDGHKVTLVDGTGEFLFAPRLIDALEGTMSEDRVRADLSKIAKRHGFRHVQGFVDRIDRHTRTVSIQSAGNGASSAVTYDRLVICTGAAANYYGIEGAEQHTFALKRFDDVKRIHARIEELLSRAKQAETAERKRLLSLVVVGGGPSGIEALSALRSYFMQRIAAQAPGLEADFSATLIQAAPQILPGFPVGIVDLALPEMKRLKMRVLVGEAVARMTSDQIETKRGEIIPHGLTVWCAGIRPNAPQIEPAPAMDAGKYLVADHFLRIDDQVFVGGDLANVGFWHVVVPKNAQTAGLMARRLAKNVLNSLAGRPLQEFRYYSKGFIITVGETGIIQLPLRQMVFRMRLVRSIRRWYYDLVFNRLTR